ncbi:MAG: hypothetical protein LAT81_10385 [Oceanicaulis sp.]|nr:hypothetical protein [Oceanicaulis sp.]
MFIAFSAPSWQAVRELAGHTADPHQSLWLELNPWAVAALALWIGRLQAHWRTHKTARLAERVLRGFHNIENRDAGLTLAESRLWRRLVGPAGQKRAPRSVRHVVSCERRKRKQLG